MENRTRFGLDKMDAELVNDILPIGINLPKNQKNLLAILIHINGIDEKDNEGYFYVDNQYLMKVLEVSEPTLIANANKLISKGFIIRKSGKKHHPSKYLITDYTKDFSKTNTKDFSKTVENFSQDKEQDKDIDKEKEIDKDKIKEYIKNIIKKEINKEIENIIEKVELREKEIFEKIDSRLELKFSEMMRMLEDKLNLIQDASTKTFSTSIETSTNTEKTNTAMNTNELTKIEELQIENAKLKERLDNCAKFCKDLVRRVSELEAKVNQTSTNEDYSSKDVNEDKTEANQDSSISSNSSSTDETSTKQEKSDFKPSNGSSLVTTHQDEEKLTEAQQMTSKRIVASTGTSKVGDCSNDEVGEASIEDSESNQEKSSTTDEKASSGTTIPQNDEKPTESDYEASKAITEDVDVDSEYELFVSKVLDYVQKHKSIGEIKLLEFKNMILRDLGKKNASYKVRKDVENKIDDLIQEFYKQSDLSHSNEQSGIVAHQEDLKPTEGKEMASTAISEDNATTSNHVDDLFDGIIISGKASKKDELKHSNKGTDCTPVQSEDTKKDDSKEVKDLKMPKTVEGCFQRFMESVEEQKKLGLNNTRKDLLYQKNCIIQSCKLEGFEESFIQELEAKIDEHIKEYSEKSDSKLSNDSTLATTHQDDSKPTEGKEMPLNEKKLRYLDTSTDKQYATEAEAQKDGVNPWFLYDWKVGRCIAEYTSPSNEQSGIVANQDDLKPIESQQMPSTSMSYSYASAY